MIADNYFQAEVKLLPSYKEVFKDTTIEDVNARLEDAQQEIDELNVYLQRISPEEMREAMSIQNLIIVSEEQFNDVQTKMVELEDKAKMAVDRLKARVQTLLEAIESNFSSLMEDLGHAGTVSLKFKTNGGQSDYNYLNQLGISILVKFAYSKGGFQEFNASVQSGGEKSLITAVYMMALQSLTKVPFRCVDEINQGMDERNERDVWHKLLNTATEHSAQYMYFAPKFPRGLTFNEQTNVIFCMSGGLLG